MNSTNVAGKYLTFQLDQETYGIEILKVREIIKLQVITKVPHMPHYLLGVINLRGKVIPVVDLRSKFSMDMIDATDESCIIVADIAGLQVGMLVDTVSEVLDVDVGSIEPAPNLGSEIDTTFLRGIGKLKDRVVLLLDIEQVLSIGNALEVVQQLAEESVVG